MTQENNESITEKRERLFRELDEGTITAMEFWEGIRKTFEGFNPDEVRQGYQEAIERITCRLLRHNEEHEVKQEAVFTIVNWSQEHDEVLDYWDPVTVIYQVENTGNCDIDFYAVNFKVTCEGGNFCAVSHFGYDLPEGGKRFGTAYIDTGGERATDVIIQRHSEGK